MPGRIETYKDAGGNFRFRVIAANGQKVATSGEGFSSEPAAKRAAEGAKRIIANAPVVKAEPESAAKAKPKPAAKARAKPKPAAKARAKPKPSAKAKPRPKPAAKAKAKPSPRRRK